MPDLIGPVETAFAWIATSYGWWIAGVFAVALVGYGVAKLWRR